MDQRSSDWEKKGKAGGRQAVLSAVASAKAEALAQNGNITLPGDLRRFNQPFTIHAFSLTLKIKVNQAKSSKIKVNVLLQPDLFGRRL
jgi:hypothetical protein